MKKKVVSFILAIIMALPFGFAFGCTPEGGQDTPDYSGIKNVIIFIGDGMGFQHVRAGNVYLGRQLSFEKFPDATKSDTVNADGLITDSAAGATALATGYRTYNGYLGKNTDGDDVKTILDYAKDKGKSVGVVTSDVLSGATPSGFSAHSNSRNDAYTIIKSQVTSGVDFFAGKFSEDYEKNAYRFKNEGYGVYDSLEGVDYTKKAVIMGNVQPKAGSDADGNPYMLLDDMTELALDYLSQDEDGFALMVEGAYIDKCSHSNDTAGMIDNVVAFDKAVAEAVKWANGRTDTVIIVTADHETGGLTVGSGATKNKLLNGVYDDITWEFDDHTDRRVPVFVSAPNGLSISKLSTSGNGDYMLNKDIFLFMLSCVNQTHVTSVITD